VGEENSPVIADPLMKVDDPLCGFGREIGSNIIDAQCHGTFLLGLSVFCKMKRKIKTHPANLAAGGF
jgi:hypothetical protein